MLRKFMMLAATVSLLALSAPASYAEDPLPEGWTQQQEDDLLKCAKEARYGGHDYAAGYIQQARTELRQASELRELANNARAYADAAKNQADKDSWNEDAARRDANAKQLEESAKRNIERAKEEFKRFEVNCGSAYYMVEGLVEHIIAGAEQNLENYQNGEAVEPDVLPEEEEQTAEVKPEPPKTETPPKKPSKPQKPKPQKPPKPNKKPKPQSASNNQAAAIAATVFTGLALGVIGNELMGGDGHHKPHKPHKPDHGVEEFEHGDHVKPIKKQKKSKKLKKVMSFF